MKEFVKPTTRENADAVMCGAKMFDYFDEKMDVKLKDRFSYAVYEDMSVTKHPISRHVYEITCVDDVLKIQTGMVLVGFRRIA